MVLVLDSNRMKQPIIIGITGGIGGGKSTLSDRLSGRGYKIYNSDLRARLLQNKDLELVDAIKKLLGDDIYKNGELDRPAVAAIVFQNKALLQQLNQLVHPAVRADFERWKEANNTENLLFVESAIMFESGLALLMDKVVLMTASEEVRIARVVKRDGISPEQVLARMMHQLPEDEKIKRAHYVIHSDDHQPLNDKIDALLRDLDEL